MAPTSSLQPLLTHAKTIVESVKGKSAKESVEEAVQQLKSVTFAITSAGRQNKTLTVEEETAVWDLVCMLWNTCVDFANESPEDAATAAHAQLRQFASDLLSLVQDETATDDERLCKCQFFHKTGKLWIQLGDFETAEACYARAMEYAQVLVDFLSRSDQAQDAQEACATEIFMLYLDRTAVAWHLNQQALASNLLARAKDLATSNDLSSTTAFQLSLMLANTQTNHATELLKADAPADQSTFTDAISLLHSANEVVENLGADEDDPEVEAKTAAANAMLAQVLRLLAWANLEVGDKPAQALNYLQALRRLGAESSGHPTMCFLTLKALCSLGRHQEAETELLTIVSSTEAKLDICLSAMKVMLDTSSVQQPEQGSERLLPAIKSALGLIQERFAEQPCVPLQLVKLLLAQEQVSEEAEDAALSLCAAEGTVKLLTEPSSSKEKTQLFTLLYSHASNHFQRKVYTPASKFFSAAYMFADEGVKARTARVLSVCNIGQQDLPKALDYVDIAAKSEPASVYNAFLRLKIHLTQEDRQAATQQIKAMLSCDDFSHEILRVAAQEAMVAGQSGVAKEALQQLHGLLVKAPAADSFKPGDEAVILTNLIRIVQETAPEAAQGAADTSDVSNGKQQEEESSEHAEMASVCHLAANRIQETGYVQFYGTEETRQAASLEWFAATCWNAALHASQDKQWQSCAVLFAATGSFYGAHPNPEDKILQYQKMAYLMATAAILEIAQELPGSLSLANKMMQQCKKTNDAICSKQTREGNIPSSRADKSMVFMLMMEFHIALLQSDKLQQQQVLRQCQEAPSFSAEHMLKLAELSQHADKSSVDVTQAAFRAALKLLLSQGHAVQYEFVAKVLRTLLELSNSDADKLKLYKEAQDLIKGLPGNTYPDRELQWLITTCWNRGAHQAKFMRFGAAQEYMQLAMGLLDHCHSLSTRKEMMTHELSTITQKLAGSVNQPEAPSTSSPKDRKRKRPENDCTAASVPLAALEEVGNAATQVTSVQAAV